MISALGLLVLAAGALLIWGAITGRSATRQVLSAVGA